MRRSAAYLCTIDEELSAPNWALLRNSLEKGTPIMMGNVFFQLLRIQTKEREFFGGRAQGSSLAIFELVLWEMSFAELCGLIRKPCWAFAQLASFILCAFTCCCSIWASAKCLAQSWGPTQIWWDLSNHVKHEFSVGMFDSGKSDGHWAIHMHLFVSFFLLCLCLRCWPASGDHKRWVKDGCLEPRDERIASP